MDMCKVCSAKQWIAYHIEQEPYHRCGHLYSTSRGSRLRSTLNTNVITGLDMCAVCPEVVGCVAL